MGLGPRRSLVTQQPVRLSFPRKEFPFSFDELRAQQRKGFLTRRPGMRELEESLPSVETVTNQVND